MSGPAPVPHGAMTSKQRMEAAFRGEPVDRVPIWLREGFELLEGRVSADEFRRGWQADPVYRELLDYVRPHVDPIVTLGVGALNRYLMVPPGAIRQELIGKTTDIRQYRDTITTPGGDLTTIIEHRRGQNTIWTVKYPVEGPEDLRKLAAVPFEVEPAAVESDRNSYRQAVARHGKDYLLRAFISSPVVCISRTMGLEKFLEFSVTEREWFHRLLQEVTRRVLATLKAVFEGQDMDTSVTLGGSEQCTPPLMAPQSFNEFVIPYDGQIIRFLKEQGALVQVHCHGKVRHALSCMIEMGVDATDPVEPPPAGDVTYAEAREIAGDRLTLIGNLEFDMLELAEPADVRAHVREILSHGKRRIVLGASAGPISAVSQRLADNYKAWIDAALEFSA